MEGSGVEVKCSRCGCRIEGIIVRVNGEVLCARCFEKEMREGEKCVLD